MNRSIIAALVVVVAAAGLSPDAFSQSPRQRSQAAKTQKLDASWQA